MSLHGTCAARTVPVDGLAIRVRTSNLLRPAGVPAVVFESGALAPMDTWDPVLDAVAQFAPVIAYDRSGTGETPWDGLPPTPSRVAARLERLLDELGASPPYVMVGHSLGGALVQYFAGTYPDSIAGILYLDPADLTMTHAEMDTLFMSVGAKDGEYEAFRRRMEQSMPATGPLGAEMAVMTALFSTDLADRGWPPAPSAPASVILAGHAATVSQSLVTFDVEAYGTAMQELRTTRLRRWVNGRGTFEIATGAGHFVHHDDPGRVIDAIRALVIPDALHSWT